MYKTSVSESLVPLTVKLHPEILEAVDSVFEKHGESRTQFVRNAIIEKLQRAGIPLSATAKLPPNRKGVGGKPTHRSYPRSNITDPVMMNEKFNSAKHQEADRIQAEAERRVKAKKQ